MKFLRTGQILIVGVLLTGSILSSCMREAEVPPRSMEQIQAEEGVPVQVEIIKKGEIGDGLHYFSKIRGWKEATEGVAVGDEIMKINAKVGDWVEKGQVIVEFPKNTPSLQYKQAEIQVETMTLTYNRAKKLKDIGEMSQQSFDEVEMQYKIAKRNLETLDQLLKVEAPLAGYITSMPFEVGDIPHLGDPLFTVSKLDKMIATINVSDSEIKHVRKGMKATATWQGETFSGRVTDISIAIDSKTQAFPVEVTFSNPKREMRPGTSVEIMLETYSNKDVIVVPDKAIVEKDNKDFVYLAKGESAQLQEIELGKASGMYVEVLNGLNENDKLINCCFHLLENGKKIQIVD
jgi:RND family efflux transporter MFP subunit